MESRVEVVAFEECQSLAGWVKWLVGGILSLQVVTFGLVGGLSEESRTAAVLGSGIALVVALILVVALTGMRMRTVVEGDVIRVRLFPLLNTQIRIADVAEAKARKYSPIGEYGGWGIRRGWSSGWAYNMRGDEGVQLVLRDGKKILIGSQRAGELADCITRSMSGSSV